MEKRNEWHFSAIHFEPSQNDFIVFVRYYMYVYIFRFEIAMHKIDGCNISNWNDGMMIPNTSYNRCSGIDVAMRKRDSAINKNIIIPHLSMYICDAVMK